VTLRISVAESVIVIFRAFIRHSDHCYPDICLLFHLLLQLLSWYFFAFMATYLFDNWYSHAISCAEFNRLYAVRCRVSLELAYLKSLDHLRFNRGDPSVLCYDDSTKVQMLAVLCHFIGYFTSACKLKRSQWGGSTVTLPYYPRRVGVACQNHKLHCSVCHMLTAIIKRTIMPSAIFVLKKVPECKQLPKIRFATALRFLWGTVNIRVPLLPITVY
jgi:hypothetical protein